METDHVVTRMIFHAITADQNARILHRRFTDGSAENRFLSAKISGKKFTTAKNEAAYWIHVVLSPGFLTVRYLFIYVH